MKQNFIKITFGRSVYFLAAGEIIQNLPEPVLTAGIRRGKAFTRAERLKARARAGRSARDRKIDKMLGVV